MMYNNMTLSIKAELLDALLKLTKKHHVMFKKMHSNQNFSASLESIVMNMHEFKVQHALNLARRSHKLLTEKHRV